MPRIGINKAIVSEADSILQIQKQAYLSEAAIYGDYDIPPLKQTLDELRQAFDRSMFYVAKDNDQIVGSVNVEIEEDVGRIGRLIVAPEWQRQGIGSMLMNYAEAQHRDLGTLELFTGHKSERNLAMYSKRGYVEVGRRVVHAGLTFVYMRKQIANKPLKSDARNARAL